MSKDKDLKDAQKVADDLDKELPAWLTAIAERDFYAGFKKSTLESQAEIDPVYAQAITIYNAIKPICEKL